MPLRIGTTTPVALYLGTSIAKAYLGTTQVWAGSSSTVKVDDRVTGTGALQWDYSAGWQTSNVDHYSSTAGATATIRWNGTRGLVYGAKDAHHGFLNFSLDGGAAVSVDTYSASRQAPVLLFDTGVLADAAHTLVCTVAGTKNASSSGTTVGIDYAEAVSTGGSTAEPTAVLSDHNGAVLLDQNDAELTH